MVAIRPQDLSPVDGGIVNPAAALVTDEGYGVRRATPVQVVDAGAPINSQAEAEAGVVNTGRMTALRVKQAIDALGVSAVVLASPAGAGMVGWQQSGTGSAAGTIDDVVSSLAASPEQFSGNPSVALAAAATAHTDIILARDATYTLPTLVDLSALNGRRIHLNGATIEAAVGFTGNHLLKIAGDCQIIGPGTFDGTNVPAPVSAYASGDYPGVGIYITGTGDNGVIDGVDFIEFQSGPILHDSATTRNGFQVRNVTLTDNQKYVTDATNSLVAMHGVSVGLMVDCQAYTYNWKAFYFANGSYNKIVRCHANGGVVGHSSHFLTGGSDNSIIDCTHTGTGFGIKIDAEARATVINFKANGSASAIYAQSCVDFQVIGGTAIDCSGKTMLIDAANGNCSGLVVGFRASRTTPGTTGDHVGIYMASFAAGVVNGVQIRDCYLRNFLFGIQIANTGFAQTDIMITDNELRNTGQYGILAYMGSGIISGNLIEMDNSSVEAAIHIERDGASTTVTNTSGQPTLTVTAGVIPRVGDTITGTGVPADTRVISVAGSVVTMSANSTANVASVAIIANLEISNNVMRGCTADNIELLTRLNHKSIRVINNRSDGGTVFVNFNCNGNAADTVSVLEITGNQGVGLTSGCLLTFNTTTLTRVKVEENNFINSSFVPVSDTITNPTNATNLSTVFYGTSTLAAGTFAVLFPIKVPSTAYRVTLGGSAGESFSWASKAVGGFTINSSNAGSTATVDWVVSR